MASRHRQAHGRVMKPAPAGARHPLPRCRPIRCARCPATRAATSTRPCAAIAPDTVFTVRTYGTRPPPYGQRFSAQLQQSRTANSQVSETRPPRTHDREPSQVGGRPVRRWRLIRRSHRRRYRARPWQATRPSGEYRDSPADSRSPGRSLSFRPGTGSVRSWCGPGCGSSSKPPGSLQPRTIAAARTAPITARAMPVISPACGQNPTRGRLDSACQMTSALPSPSVGSITASATQRSLCLCRRPATPGSYGSREMRSRKVSRPKADICRGGWSGIFGGGTSGGGVAHRYGACGLPEGRHGLGLMGRAPGGLARGASRSPGGAGGWGAFFRFCYVSL